MNEVKKIRSLLDYISDMDINFMKRIYKQIGKSILFDIPK